MNRHHEVVFNQKHFASLCAALVAAGVLFVPGQGVAQTDITGQNTYTMSNGGSTATVNVVNTGTLGMNSWTVLNGLNQLNQQWFWYSINGSTPQPINNLSAATVYNMAPSDPSLDNLGVDYDNANLEVFVQYTLSGNGMMSGSADMAESIYVINNESSSINLNFYQYSNFNLLNQPNNVKISSSGGLYTGATQTTSGAGGTGIGEVILGPYANEAEAGFATPTMSDVSSGTLNDSTSAGPGDVAWAFEWNKNLGTGDMLDLQKDKGLSVTLVPEPSTLVLIALGMGALGLSLRRKLA
jgi:hypothetical protein